MLISPVKISFDYFDIKEEVLDKFNLNIEDVYFRIQTEGFDPAGLKNCFYNSHVSIYVEWIAPANLFDTYQRKNPGTLWIEFKGILMNVDDRGLDCVTEEELTEWVKRQKFIKFVYLLGANGGGGLADSTLF